MLIKEPRALPSQHALDILPIAGAQGIWVIADPSRQHRERSAWLRPISSDSELGAEICRPNARWHGLLRVEFSQSIVARELSQNPTVQEHRGDMDDYWKSNTILPTKPNFGCRVYGPAYTILTREGIYT